MFTYLKSWVSRAIVFLAFAALMMVTFASSPAFAVDELDSLGGGGTSTTQNDAETEENLRQAQELMGTPKKRAVNSETTETEIVSPETNEVLIDVDKNEDNIGNQLKNQKYVTGDDITTAQRMAAPVVNLIGTVVGLIIVVAMAAYVLITALDIIYLSFPPIRSLLASPAANGAGGQMAGMGGGFGRMGGGMGGPASAGPAKRQWVSDAAVSVASLFGGAAPAQGQGMMNPGGYGSPQFSPQQNQEGGKKNVFWEYIKKRSVSTILFVFAIIFLTSSQLMDVGLNVAQWGIGLLDWVNGKI